MSPKSDFESTYVEVDESSLGFLTRERGFRILERKGTNFGFNTEYWETIYCKRASAPSGSVSQYVRLGTAPNRLEVDLEVSRDGSTWYAIEDLERCVLKWEVQEPSAQVVRASAFAAEVDGLAKRLREAGKRFFSGDEALWDELDRVRAERMARNAAMLAERR